MSVNDESETLAKLNQGMAGRHPFVRSLASTAAVRTTRRVVRELQKLTDCRLSGDDSGLKNIWDEVCVQCQWEQSFSWNAYEETGKAIVADYTAMLSVHEKEALWLQTKSGWDWDYDTRNSNAKCPLNEDEIVDHVWSEYILFEAGRWTNSRIRAYIERSGSYD